MEQSLRSIRRRLVRRVGLTLLAGPLMLGPLLVRPTSGRADSAETAATFLASLSDRAIRQLTQPGVDDQEKKARLRTLLREGFDFQTIGRFILGRYWRRAGPDALAAFLAAFEDMLVARFLPLLADYSGTPLRVGAVRPFGNNPNYFNVSSTIEQPGAEPVRIDWRVRRADGAYKVVDIVAEGVSIAVTLRSEYGTVLRQTGGDLAALTQTLRQRMAQP